MVAAYWAAELAQIRAGTEVASELCELKPPLDPTSVGILVSQSGNTADTLKALRWFLAEGITTMGIVNAAGSPLEEEAAHVLHTLAGPEIGVASTKAFTAQLATLLAVIVGIGKARGVLSDERVREIKNALLGLPARVYQILQRAAEIEKIARDICRAPTVLFIGRGAMYPIALEGALKLKEISYIHAEGLAAGELKHGPIALIEEGTPVIVLAPSGETLERTASSLEEVSARGARVILISDEQGIAEIGKDVAHSFLLPNGGASVTYPVEYAVPLQLLAYHTAVLKGTDVDQPRNLAKSVTVE
jgi:glucosamine--fructose-6-phosphate aminotransferase (isomerizing)